MSKYLYCVCHIYHQALAPIHPGMMSWKDANLLLGAGRGPFVIIRQDVWDAYEAQIADEYTCINCSNHIDDCECDEGAVPCV